jgi:hypothetical protein
MFLVQALVRTACDDVRYEAVLPHVHIMPCIKRNATFLEAAASSIMWFVYFSILSGD